MLKTGFREIRKRFNPSKHPVPSSQGLHYLLSLIMKTRKSDLIRRVIVIVFSCKMRAVWFVLFSLSPSVLGADILGVFSIPSISHQVFYRALMLELNKRGHNMTIVTPNPIKDPSLKNYREIDMSFSYDGFRRTVVADPKLLRLTMNIPELMYLIFLPYALEMCYTYFSSPQLQQLLNENPKFDLLITEFGANPCFYGMAKFSGNKYLGMSSFQSSPVVYSNLGSLIYASYIQDGFLYVDKELGFFQRMRNLIFQLFVWLAYEWTMYMETKAARQFLGKDLPHLKEYERNLSALLVNSHFTTNGPRPNVPNLVEIGGPPFHLARSKPKPLPKDLKDFLDDAPDGVLYFSLGTNVKTSNISSTEEEILMDAFSKIKQKVLWKWENEGLTVKSKKVMKRKWFPQVDVLAHPNVKAFVTQAGLQSVGEAIEFKVPMIVMPFFADQNHNARKMESEGMAVYLDFDDLDVPTFTRAINEVIYNKTYKENMERFSALVKDQPIPPLEKAVWWTEYVIRHNGAPHLRSAAATMPWYQYLMLDVLAVVFLGLFLIIYVTYLIMRTVFRLVFKRRKPKSD